MRFPSIRILLLLAALLLLGACVAQRDEPPPVVDAPVQNEPLATSTETPPANPEDNLAEPTPLPLPMPPPAPPTVAEAATSDRSSVIRTTADLAAQAMTGMPAPRHLAVAPEQPVNYENYRHYSDNPVRLTAEEPVSTFGIDVDTGSWTNVRRMLNAGRLPPADAVRAEEFINYFDYGYTQPTDRKVPFSVTTELAPAPWNPARQLLLVGIQGWRVPAAEIPAANLVFLIDTSGSMNSPERMPLLKQALAQLVRGLRPQDRLSIVTYAGNASVTLESTPGNEQARILDAIDSLAARGSTWGEGGLKLAYRRAREGFIKGGVNRILLATDGDFNVGQTSIEALKNEIARERRGGIALSVLGFGMGNYNDAMAVTLADAGDGSYHYIDSLREARKVLAEEMTATLFTIASDMKIQVEFNPAAVQEYRLIGYVKRVLAREDFNNDAVDAGDIGAGANVTALYEITPAGSGATRVDPLRYGTPAAASGAGTGELAFLRLRYKLPGEQQSRLVEQPIAAAPGTGSGSERLRFAAAVAAFAETLRGGRYLEGFRLEDIATLAQGARGEDLAGWRAEFVQLVRLAEGLMPQTAPATAVAGP